MGRIVAARAYANNEVALIAWSVDDLIANCLGFEVTRVYLDTGEERVLPAWVPFKGQRNPDWKEQTTSVWPVQKLMWRDLTARKRRDRMARRPADVRIKYRIRPLVPAGPGLEPVPAKNIPPITYQGDPVPLAYADGGSETNEVLITAKHGDVRAAFTNGILSAQWLRHALEELGEQPTVKVVVGHMSRKGDKLRRYLTGDVLATLSDLLERAAKEQGAEVRLALYELSDTELKDLIAANKTRVRLILSNTGKDRKTGTWDVTNSAFRGPLNHALGKSRMMNRMFNNAHIGHNKFAVLVGADGAPRAVMTGSTNWTPTGLCGQSNNAIIVESQTLAQAYLDSWGRLSEDTKTFKVPKPISAGTSNVQGPALRAANAAPPGEIALSDGTGVTLWCAPNTEATTTRTDEAPPDLGAVFSLMRKAHDAILFAAFLPSRCGRHSIIEEAIALGRKDSSLIVYGAISDPTAMPNYVPPPKTQNAGAGRGAGATKPQPAVYDRGNVHIVRAAALMKGDLIGDFEVELLKTGNAIIHDKIVVVDPLSGGGFVVMGSHNLGYKASYENDENLLIIRNNRTLVEAYAVHVMDIYEHYRFRAVQADIGGSGEASDPGKASRFDGFLSRDSRWLEAWMASDKGSLACYFSRELAGRRLEP